MVRWSIRLFQVRGVPVYVHATWWLLLGAFGVLAWKDGGWRDALWTEVYLLCMFTCIVMHEFGHIETARRFGIRTLYVVLLPIGGMARFTHLPRSPRQEIAIALAGPAVNAALATLLFLLRPDAFQILLADELPSDADLIPWIILANLAMGAFNLLPIFPMDGGRVLRGLLSLRMPYVRATYWAATLAKILAVAAIVYFSFGTFRPLTIVLFCFVMWAGEAEYRAAKRQARSPLHEDAPPQTM